MFTIYIFKIFFFILTRMYYIYFKQVKTDSHRGPVGVNQFDLFVYLFSINLFFRGLHKCETWINNLIMRWEPKCPIDIKQMALEREFHDIICHKTNCDLYPVLPAFAITPHIGTMKTPKLKQLHLNNYYTQHISFCLYTMITKHIKYMSLFSE